MPEPSTALWFSRPLGGWRGRGRCLLEWVLLEPCPGKAPTPQQQPHLENSLPVNRR